MGKLLLGGPGGWRGIVCTGSAAGPGQAGFREELTFERTLEGGGSESLVGFD